MSNNDAHSRSNFERLYDERIRHRMFAGSTFLAFNALFFLGVRPTLMWMTSPVQNSLSWLAVLVSSLWLYQVWKKRSDHHSHQRLAQRFRRQLRQLPVALSQVVGDRFVEQMSPTDLSLLANVLPDFSRQYQLKIYQGVVQDALDRGNTKSSCSLDVLYHLRQQLGLTGQDHNQVLAALGIVDGDRLDPQQQRASEHLARLTDYQAALELMLLELVDVEMPLQPLLALKYPQILVLQRKYTINDREHAKILETLLMDHQSLLQKTEQLLSQLQALTARKNRHASSQSAQSQQQLVTRLLNILEMLGEDPKAIAIAQRMSQLASHIIPGVLARSEKDSSWQSRISPKVLSALRSRVFGNGFSNLAS
jgi:hypothetical protein